MALKLANNLYGPTEDGLRLYKPTKIWHINKWFAGKTIQVTTGKLGKKDAQAFLVNYLSRFKEGQDPTIPAPKPGEPEGTGRSYSFTDAVAALSTTIAGKQQEGQITSRRSPKYREECITYIMQNYPGDI